MSEFSRVQILVMFIRQMHAHLASINDIEEIAEELMHDLELTIDEKKIVRKAIR